MRVLSVVKVADNSGARFCQCLKILNKSPNDSVNIGDIVIVSVKNVNSNKKMKKSSIQKGVVVRMSKNFRRLDGSYIRFSKTTIVLLNKLMLPLGTRVFGPVYKELRDKNFLKIISLATLSI